MLKNIKDLNIESVNVLPHVRKLNNYWMRFFVISRIIIKGEVSVISQSQRLRLITLNETLIIILNITKKPNSIIVLLYIESLK